MTKQEVAEILMQDGWAVWSKDKPRQNGSRYQTYRKGNCYVWLGNRYIEHSSKPFAVDYVIEKQEVLDLLGK